MKFRTKEWLGLTSILLSAITVLTGCATPQPTESASNGECVVLVHGLWRNGYAMRIIANALHDAGYHTVSLSYPSTRKFASQVAIDDMPTSIEQCQRYRPRSIHVVAHSLVASVAS